MILRFLIISIILVMIIYYIHTRREENFSTKYNEVVSIAPIDYIVNSGTCPTPATDSCLDQYSSNDSSNDSSINLNILPGGPGKLNIYRPKFEDTVSNLKQESAAKDDRMFHGLTRRIPIIPTIETAGCSVNYQTTGTSSFDGAYYAYTAQDNMDPIDSTLRSRRIFLNSNYDNIPLGHSIAEMPDNASAFVQLKLLSGNKGGKNNIEIGQTGPRLLPSSENVVPDKEMGGSSKA